MSVLSKKSASPRAITANSCLFGKHPSLGDFLRYNASGPAAAALDEWISLGLTTSRKLLASWEDCYYNLGPSPFIFQAAGKTLFGVLVPSTDASGREFPLTIFCELDALTIEESYAALPHEHFLVDLVTILSQRGKLTHKELIDRVASLAPPSDESLSEATLRHRYYITANRCEQVFSELFPDSGSGYWAYALERANQLTADLAAQRITGIRFPLGAHPSPEAALWLAIATKQMNHTTLNVLWNRSSLLLFGARLPQYSLTSVLCPQWSTDGLSDLRALEDIPARDTFPHGQPLSRLLEV